MSRYYHEDRTHLGLGKETPGAGRRRRALAIVAASWRCHVLAVCIIVINSLHSALLAQTSPATDDDQQEPCVFFALTLRIPQPIRLFTMAHQNLQGHGVRI